MIHVLNKIFLLCLVVTQIFHSSVWALPILWLTIFRNYAVLLSSLCGSVKFQLMHPHIGKKPKNLRVYGHKDLSAWLSHLWNLAPKISSYFVPPKFVFLFPWSERPLHFIWDSIPVPWFRNSLQAEIHGIQVVHLVCFLLFRDSSPLACVQHLKTVVLYIL